MNNYKENEIVKIIYSSPPGHSYSSLYNKINLLYKTHEEQDQLHFIKLKIKNIINHDKEYYYMHLEHVDYANKYDLIKYLKFILTDNKIYIKCNTIKQQGKLAKIYNKLRLGKDINDEYHTNNPKRYFNGNTLWSIVITEEKALDNEYSIINFNDVEYIIKKVNEQSKI